MPDMAGSFQMTPAEIELMVHRMAHTAFEHARERQHEDPDFRPGATYGEIVGGLRERLTPILIADGESDGGDQ